MSIRDVSADAVDEIKSVVFNNSALFWWPIILKEDYSVNLLRLHLYHFKDGMNEKSEDDCLTLI